MMKTAALSLFLLVFSSASVASLDCEQLKQARELVDSYYRATRADRGALNASLAELMKEPSGAACWLVRDLKPVKRTKFTSAQMNSPEAKPIWALRGLRFITKCTDPKGALVNKQQIDPRDARWDLLLKGGIQQVPFFKTWMSRDVVVVAPAEVQKQIIGSWEQWYQKDASTFRFERCTDIDAWYF
jgi:hypothetical protein